MDAIHSSLPVAESVTNLFFIKTSEKIKVPGVEPGALLYCALQKSIEAGKPVPVAVCVPLI